ncbi:unnamed protein product [Aureobasidium mustum]|uniref:Uncharacterized protein n=1 Tax=Aureobasidium mustum TaxID=2773714 RepID=A0A9N8PI06_9PEZI|nr:unnamed protein product [Aureobasidium mustum]
MSHALSPAILQRIAQLANDETLPALRATSRVLRDEVEVRFADAYFTNFYYPITPEGLERLTKIAEHTLFSQKVRNCIGVPGTKLPRTPQLDKRLGDISAAMHGKNFGILLIDNQSHYCQNIEAVIWAFRLERHKPETFTVDIQCSTSSSSDMDRVMQRLDDIRRVLRQCCPIVVRVLRGRSPAAQVTTSITPQRRRTITYTGTHTYFILTQALSEANERLVELNFSQWRWPGRDSCNSLQHIMKTESRSLRRLTIRDAHTTDSWMHEELVDAIMLCRLDFCHLSNLTSSGDGVEFRGTLEASGTDNIKACLQDMKWTSKAEERVISIADVEGQMS